MSSLRTKTVTVQSTTSVTPKLSRQIIKEAGQSYVFSWAWFFAGMVALALLSLSAYGMRTMNMFNMSKQMINISDGLAEEGNYNGAIDVLASFLESHPENPEIWLRQCDLWDELYRTLGMPRNVLIRAIDRQKKAIPFLEEGPQRKVRERVLAMELEVAKYDPSSWPGTIGNARESLQLWPDHPLATKVLAMGVYWQFVTTGNRPLSEDLPLDNLLQAAWELNPGDIDIAREYAAFLRGIRPEWQYVLSPTRLSKGAAERDREADDIIDTMVQAHPEEADAYLTRYEYQFVNQKLDFSRLDLEPDLVKALEYAPRSSRALQHAGRQMLVSSQVARSQGKVNEADTNQERAYEYFTRAIEANPLAANSYLSLGEWYMITNQVDKALATWNNGRRRIGLLSPFFIDLAGEVAYVSIEQKLYDQAGDAIAELVQYSNNYGTRLGGMGHANLNRIHSLLRGKMHFAQRNDALAQLVDVNRKIEEVRASGGQADSSLLRQAEESTLAMEHLHNLAYTELLNRLNSIPEMDYDLSGRSILSRLTGDGFVSLGRLDADRQIWERAAESFEKARRFPSVASFATVQAATARERANQPAMALAVLQDAARRSPENSMIRFVYLNTLFAQELAKPDSARNYALLESELNDISRLQGRLTQPWRIDTMRVQLQYARGGGTRQVQQECLSRLRELENDANYTEDPHFYAEVASQYSSMGSLDDFNRAVNRVRDLPGGETLYYMLRVEDARRRGDMTTALSVVDEAILVVAEAERSRFLRIKTLLENPESALLPDSEEEYGRLRDLYEEKRIHDPQTFFELANLAFSRDEVELAKNIEDRLKQIEGERTGTLWRYLAVRRLIRQAGGDPNSELLSNAEVIQREVASLRPNWDMTYVLKAEIDKASGNVEGAITSYQMAVDRNTRQPAVYRELITLLYQNGRADEGERIRRIAGGVFGPAFFENDSMFPPPYQGYYEQIYRAIQEGNIGSADELANACIQKAVENREPTDRILDLNTRIGKLFLDSANASSAERFFATVAEQGGQYVLPLAICYVRLEKTDEAFELFVRELEKPNPDPSILTSLLLLSTQSPPSEAVQQKIDRLLERLEPIFTENTATLITLANYWIDRDRLDRAVPIYRKGLEMEPNNLLFLNNLAMLLAESAREGGMSTVARGEFRENAAKRIPVMSSQPRSTFILRFSGPTAPKPEDFRFLSPPSH